MKAPVLGDHGLRSSRCCRLTYGAERWAAARLGWATPAGIIVVLRTGTKWARLFRSELGCSGKTSWRQLGAEQAAEISAALHRVMFDQL